MTFSRYLFGRKFSTSNLTDVTRTKIKELAQGGYYTMVRNHLSIIR